MHSALGKGYQCLIRALRPLSKDDCYPLDETEPFLYLQEIETAPRLHDWQGASYITAFLTHSLFTRCKCLNRNFKQAPGAGDEILFLACYKIVSQTLWYVRVQERTQRLFLITCIRLSVPNILKPYLILFHFGMKYYFDNFVAIINFLAMTNMNYSIWNTCSLLLYFISNTASMCAYIESAKRRI